MQLACFSSWPWGASAVMAVERMDPLARISPSGDTPLHWVCKAGSFWAGAAINGCSSEVDSELAALVPPRDVLPQHVRDLVVVRPLSPPSALPSAAAACNLDDPCYPAVHTGTGCVTTLWRWGCNGKSCSSAACMCSGARRVGSRRVGLRLGAERARSQGKSIGCVQELAAYKDGAMVNAVDCAHRTPLFYAHSAAAIDALLDAGADVNARDSDGLDCVAFRISESMAEDNPSFEISIKDQVCGRHGRHRRTARAVYMHVLGIAWYSAPRMCTRLLQL